ncbi:serine/threonine-protein phosphatase 4 regulatory subunit 2 [Leptidea sinapis]|uniref:serine/threonine-protein phosphatase 4 regulatory subunit 2 n=1 Tax=Leptidea sinapis TaxID=189913 RepID=UPI0021C3ABD0|nr:serine/threonine-protein phosphatase 4 regulatory subunit 2 [Leptidea sinapis]
MENAEEVFQFLEEFSKRKPKTIPQELNDYLTYVARTGDPVYQWSLVKSLFKEKLLNVITDFHESTPSIDILPCPNVDPFNYDIMKNSLVERLDSFTSAPFTVQRICELLTFPRKQYNRVDKFMRAIEKNILVVSTREPGQQRPQEPENGEAMEPIVNGSDNNSEYNVDVEMEDMSWKETGELQQNREPQPGSSDTHINMNELEARLNAKQDVSVDMKNKQFAEYESLTPPELDITECTEAEQMIEDNQEPKVMDTNEPAALQINEPIVLQASESTDLPSKDSTNLPPNDSKDLPPNDSKDLPSNDSIDLPTKESTDLPSNEPTDLKQLKDEQSSNDETVPAYKTDQETDVVQPKLIIPDIKVDNVEMTELKIIEQANLEEMNQDSVNKETCTDIAHVKVEKKEEKPEEVHSNEDTNDHIEIKNVSENSSSSEGSSASSENIDGLSNSPKTDSEDGKQDETDSSDKCLEETSSPNTVSVIQSENYSITDVNSELPQIPAESKVEGALEVSDKHRKEIDNEQNQSDSKIANPETETP